MKQLTIRGFEDDLVIRIRELAKREGISLNRAVLRLIRKGAGLSSPGVAPDTIGSALDAHFGTWSDAEADEFEATLRDFDQIDESLWR